MRPTTILFAGRASIDIGAIFSGFYAEIQGALAGIGQHFLNQGLAAVLGGIGGSRAFGDVFACEYLMGVSMPHSIVSVLRSTLATNRCSRRR